MIRHFRMFGALLRVGFAEAVAYRAEFLVWILTTTMPLINLALWSNVAHEAPFRGFAEADFVAYYLGAFIVRTLTGSWVVWELNHEIRWGTLALRLLRPLHPFVAYAAQHLAAIPLRALLALPIALVLLISTEGALFPHDPLQIALLPLVIGGAWLLTFLSMFIIGTLGLLVERSLAVFDVWLAVFFVLSGYLVPLALLPSWISTSAYWLPFRYMLGFPVEVLTGTTSRAELLHGIGLQALYTLFLGLVANSLWRVGVRRFEAYGA